MKTKVSVENKCIATLFVKNNTPNGAGDVNIFMMI